MKTANFKLTTEEKQIPVYFYSISDSWGCMKFSFRPQQLLILLFQLPKLYIVSPLYTSFTVHIPSVNYLILLFILGSHYSCLACGDLGKIMALSEFLSLPVTGCFFHYHFWNLEIILKYVVLCYSSVSWICLPDTLYCKSNFLESMCQR